MLQHLNLQSNHFSDPVLPGISDMSRLECMYLRGKNNLTGTIHGSNNSSIIPNTIALPLPEQVLRSNVCAHNKKEAAVWIGSDCAGSATN